jgi:uncharacterized protein YkwD
MVFRGAEKVFRGRIWNLALAGCTLLSTQMSTQSAPAASPTRPKSLTAPRDSQAKPEQPKPDPENTKRNRENEALWHLETAFDLLASGDRNGAKKQAEVARRLAGDAPEISFLLAYLSQREGRNDEARQHAQNGAKSSMLAARLAEQLAQKNLPAGDASTRIAALGSLNALAEADESVVEESFVDGVPTRVAQTQESLANLERAMTEMVNRERAARGLNALKWDATLAETARAHSVDMRDRNYFAHESPTVSLRAPLDRYMAVFARQPRVVAENLYNVWGGPRKPSLADVSLAQQKLMESPGHRANILLPTATHIGIGIVANSNGDLWMTQMFSRP